MPTFDNPLTDAEEANNALRGLAHATRTFENPADTYAVIGDLLGGVRSLRQVLHQLAAAHITHSRTAHTDTGDTQAGLRAAIAAADELHADSLLFDRVETHLDAASQHSGTIAWHPAAERPASSRWVNVVFLQGHDADELAIIDRDGTDAAIAHLSGYDFGDETTQAALVNGYVYDQIPTGALDRIAAGEAYTLTYNHDLGHVSLLRTYSVAEPESDPPRLITSHPVGRAATRKSPVVVDEDDSFASSHSSSPVSRGRSL
ncbi:MAG: hypothetical protein IT189_04490 [Microbacteriaceae bacterium]|nr:hypothetical protein [Microbacteriaceae bacterium]